MTRYLSWLVWAAFVAANLVTIYVRSELWLWASWNSILHLFFFASVALGLWALLLTKGKIAVISFLLILAVGQLWMIERTATFLIWSIKGFAP
jgi:hypothetical protein